MTTPRVSRTKEAAASGVQRSKQKHVITCERGRPGCANSSSGEVERDGRGGRGDGAEGGEGGGGDANSDSREVESGEQPCCGGDGLSDGDGGGGGDEAGGQLKLIPAEQMVPSCMQRARPAPERVMYDAEQLLGV